MNNIIILHTTGNGEGWCKNALKNLQLYDKYPIHIIIDDHSPITPSFQEYLYDLLIPVHISPYRWEVGAIKFAKENLKFDNLVYLQHSLEIKNLELFDLLFDEHFNNSSVYIFWRFMCYLGKYRKVALDKINIPIIYTKSDACVNEDKDCKESYVWQDGAKSFMWQLFRTESLHWLFPGFNDSHIFEQKFGRLNMRIENEYLIKWKGTWDWRMIDDSQ